MVQLTTMENNSVAAVILAGGKGTRMNSEMAKVLHPVGGKPMILRNIEKLKSIGIVSFFVVVGFKATDVKDVLSKHIEAEFPHQETPLGTGHALEIALQNPKTNNFDHLLVINGDDAALYQDQTLLNFVESHVSEEAKISMMTLQVTEENALGRVMRDENGEFEQILEVFEYVKTDKISDEINCGVYLFERIWVVENIKKVELNGKGEYPITELLNIAKKQKDKVNLFLLKNPREWAGVNTPEELEYANTLASKYE